MLVIAPRGDLSAFSAGWTGANQNAGEKQPHHNERTIHVKSVAESYDSPARATSPIISHQIVRTSATADPLLL
jgi:hypothetical protein